MLITPGNLLATVHTPDDLRKLPKSSLPQFCDELRQYIIDVVSIYGGHFGSSLGVVELTTALHYVYNTPDDQLVWDVGHQAYGHKIDRSTGELSHESVLRWLVGFPQTK